ncbi:MAG TPA: ATP-binding protein, partial [Polyangiaceae bacterium]
LATLSHELRTPLTAMLGWARLLLRSELDEKTRTQALEAVERNAAHQARLVDDLLDVSRIMTGKLRLTPRSVQLGRVVAGVLDTLAQSTRGRDLVFERDLDMNDAGVHGDADRLQQVISNLLSNAVKFTPDGGKITTRVRRDGHQVVMTVTDTGVGVLPDFLPKVFERFRQADASLARSRGGLGVGLAIVKHIVELHGGSVSVSSDGKDHGTVFSVRLPAMDAARAASPPETGKVAPQREVSRENLNGISVLVVEDDSDARSLLRFTLEQSGARVIDVDSAAGAITELDRAVPDVILCDISMPQEDGYSLIRRIRARKPQSGGNVPTAAVTAYARPEDVRHALAAGFDLHLAKPLEPRDLIAAVVRLAHKKQRAETRNSPT